MRMFKQRQICQIHLYVCTETIHSVFFDSESGRSAACLKLAAHTVICMQKYVTLKSSLFARATSVCFLRPGSCCSDTKFFWRASIPCVPLSRYRAKHTEVVIYRYSISDASRRLCKDSIEGPASLLLYTSETVSSQEDQHVCRNIIMDNRCYSRLVWEDVSCLAPAAAYTTLPWLRRSNDRSLCSCSFLVTGANAGLGYEASKELARKNGHVVMAVRDAEKGDE